jgi:sirohydrochlorin ferrochelatase
MMARAIVIVDHGSRVGRANEMLEALAALVATMTGDRVYAAHMELAEPTLAQAFDRAAADGADFIFVFPYFLSPGRHSREDIPRMCVEAAARHPGIRWHCSGPVGLDHKMAELILHRVDHCEKSGYRCEECSENPACRGDE